MLECPHSDQFNETKKIDIIQLFYLHQNNTNWIRNSFVNDFRILVMIDLNLNYRIINVVKYPLCSYYSRYITMSNTTIQIEKKTAERLKKNMRHPRETYDEFINTLLEYYERSNSQNQYDQFLHKIQQMKMKELWDNPDDEDWETLGS